MTSPKKPNILFIMSDDHAAHAISCYGSRINKTPNLDRIGNEGARFDNCFCTNSICEPSRAAILTGTYNHVNKVTTIGAGLDNRLPNVAKELQKEGYQTAIFGKWHLGDEVENRPTGFDTYRILINQGPYYDPKMVCDGEFKKFEGYTTDIITDHTIEYIEKRDPEKPFFIKCHHKAPHRNWIPDEAHAKMYEDVEIPQPETLFDDYSTRAEIVKEATMRLSHHLCYDDIKLTPPDGTKAHSFIPCPSDEELEGFYLIPEETGEKVTFATQEGLLNFKYQRYIKDYLRCIASIDDNVGRLLDYLEKNDLLDNTVIMYTSDQGFFLGDHGWYDKRFMYEESLRMPFMVRYPKEIKAGTVVKEIATNVDLPATFVDWAEIKTPEYFQGYSLRPLTKGEIPEDWQQSMYYRYWMHLSHHDVGAHYGVRTKTFKLIYYYGKALGQPFAIDSDRKPEWELFDLEKDPYEVQNVYHNPEYASKVTELKNELHRLQEKVGDTPEVEIN